MLLLGAGMSRAQDAGFKMLRYDEDYSKLKYDSSGNLYNKIKYLPLGLNGSYLSLGGEVRYQYFRYTNPGWGTEPEDRDGFILSRLLSHADLHIGRHVRVFTQLQSSMMAGNAGQSSPVDENPLDLHQFFFDVGMPAKGESQLVLRVGRQEFSYGSQRLISVREGPNNRQAFDAVRLFFAQKYIRSHAFYSTYVHARKGIFDEQFYDRSRQLWGSYTTFSQDNALPRLDLYYLGVRNNAVFVDAMGLEQRHSVGTRIWNEAGRIFYDFEAVYQFGRISTSQIRAWTVSLNAFYRLKINAFTPTIGIKTELISGDKSYGDHVVNTFNPLYPKGAYFGLASLIGPYNLSDLHPYFQIDLARKVSLSIDYDLFWRMSRNDGLYAVNGALIHDGRNLGPKAIGKQLGTEVSIQPSRFLNFKFEFTWFDAGSFLRQAGLGKDIYLAGLTAAIKY